MRIRASEYVAIALTGVAIAGCGSSSRITTKPKKAITETSQTETHIRQDWVAFFSPSTSPAVRMSLLQNGTKFAPEINALAKSPFAKESSAKVSSVKLTGLTTADVTYTVLIAGAPALKNAKGTAVKAGTSWQVADASFCQLLKLEGSAPRLCAKG